MQNSLLVMAGAAFGGLARYHLGRLAFHLTRSDFPWGTLAANLIGGLLMGLLAGGLLRLASGGESMRLLLGVGVLGGFTTFSAFSLETVLMLQRGQYGLALGYVLLSVVGAVAALGVGLFAMRTVA